MVTSIRRKSTAIYLVLMAGVLLWILFLAVSQPADPAGLWKFLPSVLTALYLVVAIKGLKNPVKQQENFLLIGIFMIMPADFFLCFLFNCGVVWAKPVGFALFCVVELCFAVWLGGDWKNILVRVVLWVAMEVQVFRAGLGNLQNFIAIFNLSLLAVNVATGWIRHHHRVAGKDLLFCLGISLFCCCDYGILIRTLMPSDGMIYIVLNMFVWACYVPCQALLAFSWVNNQEN